MKPFQCIFYNRLHGNNGDTRDPKLHKVSGSTYSRSVASVDLTAPPLRKLASDIVTFKVGLVTKCARSRSTKTYSATKPLTSTHCSTDPSSKDRQKLRSWMKMIPMLSNCSSRGWIYQGEIDFTGDAIARGSKLESFDQEIEEHVSRLANSEGTYPLGLQQRKLE